MPGGRVDAQGQGGHARDGLEVGDEVCGVLAERAAEHQLPARLHQQQLVERLRACQNIVTPPSRLMSQLLMFPSPWRTHVSFCGKNLELEFVSLGIAYMGTWQIHSCVALAAEAEQVARMLTLNKQAQRGVRQRLEDVDGGLVDGADDGAARVHGVAHRPHDYRRSPRVQACGIVMYPCETF